MPKFNKQWKVLPHGQVKAVDERIVTVEGDIPMPLGKFPRRMTVVDLAAIAARSSAPWPLTRPECARSKSSENHRF